MPATKKTTASKTPTRGASASAATDAVKLLTQDHKEVHALFAEFNKLAEAEAPAEKRRAVASEICSMLTVHATIEEEIFYPAAREAEVDAAMLDEAEVEHASAKDLIAQIEAMEPDDPLFNAKVMVLGEYIDHHVKEEQDEMFPACKKAKMDLQILGEELAARKSQLMAETV